MASWSSRIGYPALIAIALSACSGESDESADPTVARGELIYRNVCTVCHNANPDLHGTIGPAIGSASRELLEAKLLRGEYPSGHTPKRDTQQMPRFEYLEPNLGEIAAFLASGEG